ncbi:3'-5' exonuclease [Massilia psychrophila]|jgi:RNA polymerase sigma factor for flagellar operon FliA|uniref:3'-5' exonuclease n=1 Tax=Massilia psychrophila TaxID=1603353 RepID=A0A2G8T4G3_9BURK|nr:3'-5' exonuclease [Massilia psychrophila]PIL40945.1 3'-5' exonuclease [Massilia psychrophila]GGE69109.1 ribonuclease D [Massilia psychrophila]
MLPEQEELLPPYDGIKLTDVRIVKSDKDAAEAMTALMAADVLGFDTESKPTFLKGELSTGPHLVQLATDDCAYLFQIGAMPAVAVLKAVLESTAVLKVGFGLSDDVKRLRAKLGIETGNVLDLSTALRKNERNTLGAKTAVARFFGKKLQKSKKITTTNWALPRLSEKQILYAADDAHVALKIYRRWRLDQAAE